MANSKILIVEDDKTLLEVLKYNLMREGYEVVTALDGLQALKASREEKPDLVILDIMLPELNGLEVCRILRKETIVPVIMLTAKVEEIDRIVGLEMGADDYVTKPFKMRELIARVRALLRRMDMLKRESEAVSEENSPVSVRAGELEVDFIRHQVTMNGSFLEFTPKEFDLLAFLMKNKGRVLTRDHLLDKVWGYEYAGDTRTVDVHVRWLRQKIEKDATRPRYLLTVRGIGYKFEDSN